LSVTAQVGLEVRVTVDGVVAYSGLLSAGESRSWEGSSRIQLWTNNAKSLLVTVNGYALGPMAVAIGHPDWNSADWGWSAGWKP